jgi:hypothetical protein
MNKKNTSRRISNRVVYDIETMEVLERDSYQYSGPVEECTIVNSVATFTGVGAELIQSTQAIGALGGTFRVPAAGSISPAVCRGYWRMKLYNQTVATSFSSLQVQASDGTNTVVIDEIGPPAAIAITATTYVDCMSDFIFDYSTAGGGATGTLQNFGATFFQFVIVMTGAGGTCSGDFEIAAEG